MKYKRLAAFALAIMLVVTAFAGCAQEGCDNSDAPPNIEASPEPEPVDEPVPEPEPTDGFVPVPNRPAVASFQSDIVTRYPAQAAALLQPEYGEEDAAAQTVASGANRFALRLSNELVSKDPDKNFVCSPYSVWLPLAALLNATDETQREAVMYDKSCSKYK